MVDIYSEFLSNSYDTKKSAREGKEKSQYLNIWKINPSFKDINRKKRVLKLISLFIMGFGYFCALYLLSANLIISIGLSSIIIIIFILVFNNRFFYLSHFLSKGKFQPFSGFIFWKMMKDPLTLFYSHKNDYFSVGIRSFQIEVIPQNIHANMKQFIRSLNSSLIPFSFQVIQKPIINNHQFSFKTILLFNVYYFISGRPTYAKLRELIMKLEQYSSTLRLEFAANFHHFKIKPLSNLEVIDSIRASFIPQNLLDETLSDSVIVKNTQRLLYFSKIILIIFVICFLDVLFSLINIHLLVRIGVIICISIIFILIWARDLLYQVVGYRLFGMNDIETLNPFYNILFYRFSQIPDTIFYHVEDKLTGGIKMVNIKDITPPPLSFTSKFYVSLIKEKMPFTCSFLMAPLSYYQFEREGFRYLNQKEKEIHLQYIKNTDDELRWISKRAGVWKVISTFSTSWFQESNRLDREQLLEIEFILQQRIKLLGSSFKGNFPNFTLQPLRRNSLCSGLQMESLKNKFIRIEGSHLNYLLMQGKTIAQIIDIVDEFKKGVDTRIAAEFNSPLQLKNDIVFGNTINTEFLEEEIPAGITIEQLHKLLIMNGTIQSREYVAMKLVMGLIQYNYPALIFDFYGDWANIISYFKGTKYANNFLYFKLGKTLNLNPIKSEIPYDKNNIEYLDYMLDAYGLCFKKDGKTMEMFRNTIIRNAEVDLSTLNLDLASKQEWEKNPVIDALLGFLQEFSEQDMVFFRPVKEELDGAIKPYEFITTEKTIIIDLSHSNDLAKKCFFMLIILSKCIHYLKTDGKYISKFLILPHIDIVFDGYHLDKQIQYGKIDKFLQPLTRHGFGLIFSSAQTHYLHPNLFNYFDTYISFKTPDSRDIAQLKNILSLEEVHGQGIYSKSRNESYQIKYLMSMKPDEALLKRPDLYQPFPVKFEFSDIKELHPINWSDIVEYMGTLGYDLEHTERSILEQAKKTIFEKDFGDYAVLIEDIIKFLEILKTVDNIGNLYINKVKEELKKAIYSKLSMITKDKHKIKGIREKIFKILLKHGYLVENHPKRASGGESIRTSYSVGPHFEKAKEDYFITKHEVLPIPEVEVLDSESNIIEIFGSPSITGPMPLNEQGQAQFLELLTKEVGDSLYWELFTLHKHLARNNTNEVVRIATNFVKRFFYRLYSRFYEVNYAVIDRDIENFISILTRLERFPFSKTELNHYMKKYSKISDKEPMEYYKAIYQELSNFFTKIQDFICLQ